MNDALQSRFDEGRDEGIESVAIRMGLKFADIQKATDLPMQRLEQLAIDNSNH